MNRISSPLKHKEGNAAAHNNTVEADWHVANPNVLEVDKEAEAPLPEGEVEPKPDNGYENEQGGWVWGTLGAKDPGYKKWIEKSRKKRTASVDALGKQGTYIGEDGTETKKEKGWKWNENHLPINQENTKKKDNFYYQYEKSGLYNDDQLAIIKENIDGDFGGTKGRGINYEKNTFGSYKLDKNGLVTNATKAGDHYSFDFGNSPTEISSDYSAFMNRQIDTGKWGYNPLTGALIKLSSPVAGISAEQIDMRDNPEKYGVTQGGVNPNAGIDGDEDWLYENSPHLLEEEESTPLLPGDKLKITQIDPFDVSTDQEYNTNNKKDFIEFVKNNLEDYLSAGVAYGDGVTRQQIIDGEHYPTSAGWYGESIFQPGTNYTTIRKAGSLLEGEFTEWDSKLDELWYMFGEDYINHLGPDGSVSKIKPEEIKAIEERKDWESPSTTNFDYNENKTLKENISTHEALVGESGTGVEWQRFIQKMNERGSMTVGDIADYWGISYEKASKYYDFYYDPKNPLAKWQMSPKDARNQEHFIETNTEAFTSYTEDVLTPILVDYLENKDFQLENKDYSGYDDHVIDILGNSVNAWEEIPKGVYFIQKENNVTKKLLQISIPRRPAKYLFIPTLEEHCVEKNKKT